MHHPQPASAILVVRQELKRIIKRFLAKKKIILEVRVLGRGAGTSTRVPVPVTILFVPLLYNVYPYIPVQIPHYAIK
jgi:hypothetical protein